MAQPRESSLSFSLDELRQIERDRVAAEEAEHQARIEAERHARIEAERQAAERERREIAAKRQLQERQESARRAEAMRVEEAERRARVEAEARLTELRIARDLELRRMAAERRRPRGLALLAVALIAAAALLGAIAYRESGEVDARVRALDAKRAEIRAIGARLEALLAAKQEAFEARRAARDEADERAAAARAAEIDREIAAKKRELRRAKKPAPPRPPPKVRESIRPADCSVDDPLCGADQ